VLLIAGPEVFGAVFGPEWTEAGRYARILAIWFALIGVASPLTRLFDVLERQKLDLTISAVSFVIVSATLIGGGLTGNITTVLCWLAVAGCATRLTQLTILLRLGEVSYGHIITPWIKYAVATAPMAALLLIALRFSTGWQLAGLAGGLVLYGLTLIALQLRENPAPIDDPD
jgi:O-antigen/teichoic acid export membrane protein